MISSSEIISPLEIIRAKKPGIATLGISLGVIALLAIALEMFEFGMFLPFLVPVLVMLFFAAKSNDFWVFAMFCMFPFILLSRDDGMKPTELGAMAFLLMGIFYYLLKYHIIKREQLIYNWGDLALMLFWLFLLPNAIIAKLNAVEVGEWIRGFLTMTIYLMYFPLRRYLRDGLNVKYFLIAFSICIIAVCVHHLAYIKYNAVRATMAYQLESSLRINLTLMALAIYMSITFVFDVKEKWLKLLLSVTLGLAIAGVITSFARATWLTVLVLLIANLFVLSRKQRITLVVLGFLALIVSAGVFVNQFKNYDLYIKLINKKFLSSKDGKKDISIRMRLYEYNAVIKDAQEYPYSGVGMQKKFRFKNVSNHGMLQVQNFTHNSFLHFWYMYGIPTTVIFIVFLLYFLVRSGRIVLLSSKYNLLQRKYAFIGFAGLTIAILHAIVSPQMSATETIIVVFISVSFLNDKLMKSAELEYKA